MQFWKCKYPITGILNKEGELKDYDFKTKETNGNYFEYFDIQEDGEIEWLKMIIYFLILIFS